MERHHRQKLLPTWIRVFSWIFLVMGALIVPFSVLALLINFPGNYSLFGFAYHGSLRHLAPLAICAAFVLFGFAGFSLLWGQRGGRLWGLAAGYTGLAISCSAFIWSLSKYEQLGNFSSEALARYREARGAGGKAKISARLGRLARRLFKVRICLFMILGNFLEKKSVGPWLLAPNPQFPGLTQLQLIERLLARRFPTTIRKTRRHG